MSNAMRYTQWCTARLEIADTTGDLLRSRNNDLLLRTTVSKYNGANIRWPRAELRRCMFSNPHNNRILSALYGWPRQLHAMPPTKLVAEWRGAEERQPSHWNWKNSAAAIFTRVEERFEGCCAANHVCAGHAPIARWPIKINTKIAPSAS